MSYLERLAAAKKITNVKIILNNNRSRIIIGKDILGEIREHPFLKIRSKGAFFSPQFRKGQWDGFIRYVWENGSFPTGLIDLVIKTIEKLGYKYTMEDSLEHLDIKKGKAGVGLRDYQYEAVEAVIDNTFKGVVFQRGILHEATNAGKSYIAMGLYAYFGVDTLLLINNKLIHEQLYDDLKKKFPNEVGIIGGKARKPDWRKLNVCMVGTLSNLIRKDRTMRAKLARVKVIMVDECDIVITMKYTQHIISFCYDAPVRVGLSGTVFGAAIKYKERNNQIQQFFGPIIHHTSNKELVEKGVSTDVTIKIISGNISIKEDRDYKGEHEKGIIRNRRRNRQVWKVAERAMNTEQLPMLILFKYHRHVKYLQRVFPESLSHLKVEYVHHKTPDREAILRRFKKGRTDILVASMIFRRGMNLPLVRTMLNAAGGDSERNVIQLLGRLLRKHKEKEHGYLYDFYDLGAYLMRHSKHRLNAYKGEGFRVLELYKKKIKGIKL